MRIVLSTMGGDQIVTRVATGDYLVWALSGDALVATPWSFAAPTSDGWLTGDLDGDGWDEILIPDGSEFQAIFGAATRGQRILAYNIADGAQFDWRAGDFNGDGYADLLRQRIGVGVEILRFTGSEFVSAGVWTGSGPGSDGWYVGEFNQDLAADIFKYVPGENGADLWYSDPGSARFVYGGSASSFAHEGDGWRTADFNGDGFTDLIDQSGQIYLFEQGHFLYFGSLNLMPNNSNFDVGDWNGDGIDELAIFPFDNQAGPSILWNVLDLAKDLDKTSIDVRMSKFLYSDRLYEFNVISNTSISEYRLLSYPAGSAIIPWVDVPHVVAPVVGATFSVEIQGRTTNNPHVVDNFGSGAATVLNEAVATAATDLSRFSISNLRSDVSMRASDSVWRQSIGSFEDFDAFVASQAEEAGATSTLDRALFYMQWISGLWHYGGLSGGPGGVFSNEVTGTIDPATASISTYLNSPIGLCTDYAALLGHLLESSGYQTRIILGAAHVFNEAQIDGEWWTFDAQTGFAFHGSWDQVIDPSNQVDVLSFTHAGMTAGSSVYSQWLVSGTQLMIASYASGFFPGATRYQLVDWYKTLPYGSALLSDIDATNWVATPLVSIESAPAPAGLTDSQSVDLLNASRYTLAEYDSAIPEQASTSDWRGTIQSLDELTSYIANQADAARDQYALVFGTEAAGLVAAFHWVSSMWSPGALAADSKQFTFGDFIQQRVAAPEEFAALFVQLARKLGFAPVVESSGGQEIVEVRVGENSYSFLPALGLVVGGDWKRATDGHSAANVWYLNLSGTDPSRENFAPTLQADRIAFVTRAADGLFQSSTPIEGAAWATTLSYGWMFGSNVQGTEASPTVWSIVLTSDESSGDATLLEYRVSFSEAVDNVDVGDFKLLDGMGTITAVEPGSSPSVFLVRVSTSAGTNRPTLELLGATDITSDSGMPIIVSNDRVLSGNSVAGEFGSTNYLGSQGYDEVDYSFSLTSNAAVNADLQVGGRGGDSEGDTFSSVEGLAGSSLADTLSGDAHSNILRGNAGDDILRGRGGADVLIGGLGNDTATYDDSSGSVQVDLAGPGGMGADAEGDRLYGIEKVVGSAFSDVLMGDGLGNRLTCGAGDDLLHGRGGADVLDGGLGSDTADYGGDFGAVWIDLASGAGRWNYAEGDTLASVENITGTDYGDWLYGNATANRLTGGAGDDLLHGRGGADVLDGGLGSDTADYGGDFGAVWIDLASGAGRWNYAEGDTLASVENITGTDYGDWLYGNATANRLTCGAGDDLLHGRGGADVLDGGLGSDTADYGGDFGAVWIDLASGAGRWNYAEGDTLASVENITGTDYGDWLYGNATANRLTGGAGDDLLHGRGGADVLDGGLGSDTADYGGDFGAVWIDLASGAGRWNYAEGDTLASVENITGTDYGDWLYGNATANRLTGGAGDDLLHGRGGADVLDGGLGSDTADYGGDFGAVWIDLASGAGRWNYAEGDTLASVENITGTDYGDWLYGNATANRLTGGAGDDLLHGRGGADVLDGGLGSDTADYGGDFGAVWIDLASGAGRWNYAEGDTLASVENITGTDYGDWLYGNATANRLTGGAGDDLLVGGAGLDVAVFEGVSTSYSLVTNTGSVTVVDNQNTQEGNEGTDTISGIETLEFKGGIQVGVASPIVLDLNGDGITTLSADESSARFDLDGDGERERTSWIGSTEGFLFLDRDRNGALSRVDELSFTDDVPGASSDLDGLRAFDTNFDGILSADDKRFADFHIWQDRNGNGQVDENEILSLADARVASLDLAADPTNAAYHLGDTVTVSSGTYARTDGQTMRYIDAALTYFHDYQLRAPSSRLPLSPRGERPSGIRHARRSSQGDTDTVASAVHRGHQVLVPEALAFEGTRLDPEQHVGGSIGYRDQILGLIAQDMASFGAGTGVLQIDSKGLMTEPKDLHAYS